jgi:aminobenzoyl-glutamate utilization protein B
MVREGVFDGVDACLSHHPSSMNLAALRSNNANNAVKFHFHGKTSHAAGSPEQGRSSLDAVELMNIGVNFLREHIIQDARIHYVIEEGGGQPNVVPDYARSWYLIRAPERDQLEPIYQRVLRIAEGAALMSDTKLEVEFIKGIYNKLPNKILSEIVTSNMREMGTPEYTDEEMEFARKLSETVPAENKRDSLWSSKRPDWEELIDVIIDKPWLHGRVGRQLEHANHGVRHNDLPTRAPRSLLAECRYIRHEHRPQIPAVCLQDHRDHGCRSPHQT